MINLIKKYCYLLHIFIVSIIIDYNNIKNVILIVWLIIMFLSVEVLAIDKLCDLYRNTGTYYCGNLKLFSKKWLELNLWAIFIGMLPSAFGIYINYILWWIIVMPVIYFVILKIKNNNFKIEEK